MSGCLLAVLLSCQHENMIVLLSCPIRAGVQSELLRKGLYSELQWECPRLTVAFLGLDEAWRSFPAGLSVAQLLSHRTNLAGMLPQKVRSFLKWTRASMAAALLGGHAPSEGAQLP